MSEEENEESEEENEESEDKTKKKTKSLKEIQEEKQKTFKKKIEEAQGVLNNCKYLKELNKSKHPLENSKVDPPCHICGKPSIWDIKIANKEGFNLNDTEHLCQKEIDKKIKICSNPLVPFLINAPCICFKENQKCLAFPNKSTEQIPKLAKTDIVHLQWEDNCKNLERIEWHPIDDKNKKCSICGLPAIKMSQITPKLNHKSKEIYVCERHSKINIICKSDFVKSIIAPCCMLEDSKDCRYFM